MSLFWSSFATLLRQAQEGNGQAFDRLISPEERRMKEIARRGIGARLAVREDFEDIYQESVLEAWRDLAKFEGTTELELRRWLRTIVIHQILEAGRRHHNAACRALNREVPAAPSDGSHVDGYWVSHHTSPSQRAIRDEQTSQLEQALKQLPPDERLVVRLSKMEQLTQAQIAALVGKTPSAVAGLLCRGLNRLRTLLENP